MFECLVIGVGGPSGAGKSTLCRAVRRRLGYDVCTIIEMDRYYRDQGHLPPAARDALDYDQPEMIELDLLVEHLDQLVAGSPVRVPTYDIKTHTRIGGGQFTPSTPVIVVEGLFCLTSELLRASLDWSVFVATDDDTCLSRRLTRDVATRGRTAEQVHAQYNAQVRPAAERFVLPSAFHARRVAVGTRPPEELCDAVLGDILELAPGHRFWQRWGHATHTAQAL